MAKRYNILTRCLAAMALLFVYFFSTSAILIGATTSAAQAYRGRGGGRGYAYRGRGVARGYGYRGRGLYVAPRAYYGSRCFYNRWGALVCRY
jgi:hypothetical protein